MGGLVYLRMLQKSVDGIGASGLGEAAGGIASQPRLLVPIVLVLSANRRVALGYRARARVLGQGSIKSEAKGAGWVVSMCAQGGRPSSRGC